MAEILSLHNGAARPVHDGDCLAKEEFTHLIPHVAAHEIIRQGQTDLNLVRLMPDIIFDQLIGMGRARRLVFGE